MNGRLVMALLSGTAEEGALVAIMLLGLPRLDIELPLWALILLMLLLALNNTVFYLMGSRALRRPATPGLPDMVGTLGRTTEALDPDGMVLVRGELWRARARGGIIDAGCAVRIVGQRDLRLEVTPEDEADNAG